MKHIENIKRTSKFGDGMSLTFISADLIVDEAHDVGTNGCFKNGWELELRLCRLVFLIVDSHKRSGRHYYLKNKITSRKRKNESKEKHNKNADCCMNMKKTVK